MFKEVYRHLEEDEIRLNLSREEVCLEIEYKLKLLD